MKKSVIREIFNGARGHMETMKMPREHFEHDDEEREAFNELKKKLSPGLFKLLQKYTDALEYNYSEEVDYFFVEGFKLGLLIGIECMDD